MQGLYLSQRNIAGSAALAGTNASAGLRSVVTSKQNSEAMAWFCCTCPPGSKKWKTKLTIFTPFHVNNYRALKYLKCCSVLFQHRPGHWAWMKAIKIQHKNLVSVLYGKYEAPSQQRILYGSTFNLYNLCLNKQKSVLTMSSQWMFLILYVCLSTPAKGLML